MQGRRLPDGAPHFQDIKPGDYWKSEHGHWYVVTPNNLHGSLRNHTIVEHDDGTISVSPSMLVNQGSVDTWHGYLERGVWRTC